MSFSFRNWLKNLKANLRGMRRHGKSQSTRLLLEPLEGRLGPAVLTVNSLLDNTTADAVLTLREAILLVNNGGSARAALGRALTAGESSQINIYGGASQSTPFGTDDTIQFDPSLFASGPQTITLSLTGDGTAGPSAFGITTQVTITGPTGSNGLTLANAVGVNQRLFDVAPTGNLTLQNLTLTGGDAQGGSSGRGGGGAGLGGAIFNQGALNVLQCTLSGNTASGGAAGAKGEGDDGGGGLGGNAMGDNGGGPNGGAFTGNSGGFGGGGFAGTFDGKKGATAGASGGFGGGGGEGGGGGFGGGAGESISAPSKKGQTSALGSPGFGGGRDGGGAGMGGAIFNAAGAVTITNSILTENAASGGVIGGDLADGSGFGGALFNLNGRIALTNDTLFSNTVAGSSVEGGAVYTMGLDGVLASGVAGQTATIGSAAGAKATFTNTTLTTNQANVSAWYNYASAGTPTTTIANEVVPTVTGISPKVPLQPGTSVTITGTNFTFATAVNFATTPATSFYVDSPTQITAIAPAGTGGGDVTVVDAVGTSALSFADDFAFASNDEFPLAYPLAGVIASTTGDNVGYTEEPGEPDPTGGAAAPLTSAWWQWTAPASGPVEVDTFGSNFATTLGIFTGASVTSLVLQADRNNASPLTFTATAGTTYDIDVNGAAGATGNIKLNLAMAPTVTGITPNVGTLSGGQQVTITGTNFSPNSTVSFGGIPATSVVFVSPTQLTVVTPADPAPLSTLSQPVPGPADVTVTGNSLSFTKVSGGYVYSNDAFANAALFTATTVNGTIAGTASGNNVFYTAEPGEPNPAGVSLPNSAWWQFTAPADGTVTVSTLQGQGGAEDFGTTLGVYTGAAVASLTSVGENYQTSGTLNGVPVESQVTFQATGGTTYYIDVCGFNDGNGNLSDGDINLALSEDVTTSLALTDNAATDGGGPVTLTATLSAFDVQGMAQSATGDNLGTVQFQDGGVNVGAPQPVTLANGVFSASFTTTLPDTGTQAVTADFGGTPDATASVSNTDDVAGLTLTGISPASARVGAADTTITLTGTDFEANATAEFNGTPLTTTVVSSTQATAVIPAADLATPGSAAITVVNPDGTTSAAQTFTLTATPAPTPMPTPNTLTISAPKKLAVKHGQSVRLGVTARATPANETVAVTISSAHRVFELKKTIRGLHLHGNGSGSVAVSGSLALVNKALAAISFEPGTRRGNATISVSASAGGITTHATIAVKVT
jgi:hypothetical protein